MSYKNNQSRIKDLESKIEAEKEKNNPKKEGNINSPISYVLQVGIELLAGAFVGGILGFYTDKFFETKPLFFICFLILGIFGGMLNLYKSFTK